MGHSTRDLLIYLTMVAKFVLAALMAVTVMGAPRPDSAPQYGPPPSYPAPSYKEPGMPFDFAYAVKDDYKGVDFAHDESSDGHVTSGSYRVALPDGPHRLLPSPLTTIMATSLMSPTRVKPSTPKLHPTLPPLMAHHHHHTNKSNLTM